MEARGGGGGHEVHMEARGGGMRYTWRPGGGGA